MKISLITVCYNSAAVIRTALDSVLRQTWHELEYRIVDGGSTDGTFDIVREYEGRFGGRMHLTSEPDNGLYDALNKGIGQARGDVIGLVHADDFLAHQDVLKHVAEAFAKDDVEAVYGDLQYVREKPEPLDRLHPRSHASRTAVQPYSFSVVRQWESGMYDPRKLTWGWMPPHPTLYLRRNVYDRARLPHGEYFDTDFTCAADYDFMLRILPTLRTSPVYLPEVLVRMRVGGVSNRSVRHLLRKSLEDYRVLRRNRVGGFATLAAKNLRKLPQFVVRRWCFVRCGSGNRVDEFM